MARRLDLSDQAPTAEPHVHSTTATTTLCLSRALLLCGPAARARPPSMQHNMESGQSLVSAATWMEDRFLGVSEEVLLADRARFIETSSRPELSLRHADGTTTWRAGRFECLSVGSLRERVIAADEATAAASSAASALSITVVDGIDIGREQASLSTEQRAIVQIASNFNCLEVRSASLMTS